MNLHGNALFLALVNGSFQESSFLLGGFGGEGRLGEVNLAQRLCSSFDFLVDGRAQFVCCLVFVEIQRSRRDDSGTLDLPTLDLLLQLNNRR